MPTLRSRGASISRAVLSLRFWWRRVPPRAFVPVAVVALTVIGTMLMRWGTVAMQGIGANLVADGIVMAITVFLLDRLLRAQTRRDALARTRIVHRSHSSIHAEALALWGILLSIALRLDECLDKGEQDFQNEFAKRLDVDPFSMANLEAMQCVGSRLLNHDLRDLIITDIEARSKRLCDDIRRTQSAHDSALDPKIYGLLDALLRSPFLRFCSDLSRIDLINLGGNITFTSAQQRALMGVLFGNHHIRDDQRPLDVLPHGDDPEIPQLFRSLADELDNLGDDILTQRAHRVARSLTMTTLLFPWLSYRMAASARQQKPSPR